MYSFGLTLQVQICGLDQKSKHSTLRNWFKGKFSNSCALVPVFQLHRNEVSVLFQFEAEIYV